jgi:hypothetical protein
MNRYEKYLKANCKWCANGPIVWLRVDTTNDGPWHIDELGNPVERCTALSLVQWAEQTAVALEQVDDVLIVNWITAKDNDYRKALADLVSMNIAQHDDPVLAPDGNTKYEDDKIVVVTSDFLRVSKRDGKACVWDNEHKFPVVIITQHDDPILNPPITGVAIRHRETKVIFSMPRPARHHTLIRELTALGELDFAKGEQGFVTETGEFLDREQAFVHAARFGQLKRKILFSEDLW